MRGYVLALEMWAAYHSSAPFGAVFGATSVVFLARSRATLRLRESDLFAACQLGVQAVGHSQLIESKRRVHGPTLRSPGLSVRVLVQKD